MVDATDLKSVLAKSGVWVRIPSSAASRMRFYVKDDVLPGRIVAAVVSGAVISITLHR